MKYSTMQLAFQALVAALLAAPAVHAQYRCADPPSAIDRRACEMAKQSPQALRQFIHNRRVIESLYFHDYVDDAMLRAWDASEERERAGAASKLLATSPATSAPELLR